MKEKTKIWCDDDEHNRFEYYADFNDWIESDEAITIRQENNIDFLKQPSKAFFASNMEAYDQALEAYRLKKRHEVLNENYFRQQADDDHWFQRNLDHFDQLVEALGLGLVVPFIGAGISVDGGYPSWKDHLRQQGRTAGIDRTRIEQLLREGLHETIIKEIETKRGPDVFKEEIRDVFSRPGEITYTTRLLTELFRDSLITTNYDRLLEQAFEQLDDKKVEVINGAAIRINPAPQKVTIYKLHGDVKNPANCILSKGQYDKVYGMPSLQLTYPIPKMLSYFYRNSNLLFLGCSLNNDRTIQVFRAAKEQSDQVEIPQHFAIDQAPETEKELVERNEYLRRLGVTGIWFEKGRFEYVESILRLALNELRYRGVAPDGWKTPKAKDVKRKSISRIKNNRDVFSEMLRKLFSR